MSIENLPGSNKRPARRADNLATIYERMSKNVGASTSRNPKGLHGLYRDNFTFTVSLIGNNKAKGYCTLEYMHVIFPNRCFATSALMLICHGY
jgi:hypothetical protein